MNTTQQPGGDRGGPGGSNRLELLLFRLGCDAGSEQSELFAINIFKVREIVAMPRITAMVGAHKNVLGVADLRGQIMQVLDLPAMVGCTPQTGLNLMLVTEFARGTQAFAVEAVEEIVQVEWSQVLAAENTANGLVTSVARLDEGGSQSRLAQVLDVEAIVRAVNPNAAEPIDPATLGPKLKPGTVVLAADDSAVARSLIEQGLHAMGATLIMAHSGKEAWDRLEAIDAQARKEGKTVLDKLTLVLTDVEMPGMDGFTLTHHIKQDPRFKGLPVVIHSSLSGTLNEDRVRQVGADAYVAKFSPQDLAQALRKVLA